jgi:hypothetical protein
MPQGIRRVHLRRPPRGHHTSKDRRLLGQIRVLGSRVDQRLVPIDLLNRPLHRGQRAHRIAGRSHQERHL